MLLDRLPGAAGEPGERDSVKRHELQNDRAV